MHTHNVRVTCMLVGVACVYAVVFRVAPPPTAPSATVLPHSHFLVASKWDLAHVPVDVPPPSSMTPLQQAAVAIASRDGLRQGEIIMSLTTSGAVLNQVAIFVSRLQVLGIKQQYLLVCVDEEPTLPGGFCEQQDIHCIHRPRIRYFWDQSRPFREVVSAMKFAVVSEVLRAGVNVLLSDTDIVYFDNPFCHLHRDSDVEGMTDAWVTKGGIGSTLGWSTAVNDPPLPQPWIFSTTFLNSGFFLVRSSEAGAHAMAAIAERLTHESMWDQAAYNEELLTPRSTYNYWGGISAAHERARTAAMAAVALEVVGEAPSPEPLQSDAALLAEMRNSVRRPTAVGGRQPTVRVMDLRLFANSKVGLHLFDPMLRDHKPDLCPVVLHYNYHVDKAHLMSLGLKPGGQFQHCIVNVVRDRCQQSRAPCVGPGCHPPNAPTRIPGEFILPHGAVNAGNGGAFSEATRAEAPAVAAALKSGRGEAGFSSQVRTISGVDPSATIFAASKARRTAEAASSEL